MAGLVFWVLLSVAPFVKGDAPSAVRITSSGRIELVKAATGDYVVDGLAFGANRYKLNHPTAPRFLYRNKAGVWTITSSAANVDKGKGTIASTSVGETPVGLRFNYYKAEAANWYEHFRKSLKTTRPCSYLCATRRFPDESMVVSAIAERASTRSASVDAQGGIQAAG